MSPCRSPSFFSPETDPIAYHQTPGTLPGVLFLGGFRSHMGGSKAIALQAWCKRRRNAFLRFDYWGHGQSARRFEDCTLSDWLANAETMLLQRTRDRQVLVGSSMGGWLALLLARKHPAKVAAVLGIAAAPDFTERLLRKRLSPHQTERLEAEGQVAVVAPGGDGYVITRRFLEDAQRHQLLHAPIDLSCPVRLLHGTQDMVVPWQMTHRLQGLLRSPDVRVHLIGSGEHTLSTPSSLRVILQELETLLAMF